jgi:protein-tyrosine phosphatase
MTHRVDRPALIETGDQPPTRELAQHVRARLAAGALLGLPTETVYGIAARADLPEALGALRELKGRSADMALTWHVPERSAVERFEPLRPLVRRLAQRYWPGPLTLVLQGVPRGLELVAREGWTGLRLPAHATTVGLLAACEFPVVLSSANRSGEPPLTRASDLLARFGAGLELVVDGGPARIGEASGVLRVGRGHFELLREGLLALPALQRTAGLRIAFVCTGNTCRSPMAEALARALLAERLGVLPRAGDGGIGRHGFELASLGILASLGTPASPAAIELLAQRGLDLAAHRSRPATPESLSGFDRIYALTQGHREALCALLPPGRAPAPELLDPAGADIADPIGAGREAYQRCLAEIERALRARLDEWA